MTELNEKLAEFVWGKDNVKLLWGHTDECGDFSIVPPEYKKEKFDTGQRLCFFDTCWQVVPDFPNDLNACFKWLVDPNPDIISVKFVHFKEPNEEVLCYVTAQSEPKREFIGQWKASEGKAKLRSQYALAFCKAVEQLLEKA